MCTFRRFYYGVYPYHHYRLPVWPGKASLAGLLFGLGSLYKASATYVMPADAVFSPFRSDFPIGPMLSVSTRIAVSVFSAVWFQAACKSKRKNLCKLLITIAAIKLLLPSCLYCDGVALSLLSFAILSTFISLKKATSSSCRSVLRSFWRLTSCITVPLSRPIKTHANEYESLPCTGLQIGFVLGGRKYVYLLYGGPLDRLRPQPYVLKFRAAA